MGDGQSNLAEISNEQQPEAVAGAQVFEIPETAVATNSTQTQEVAIKDKAEQVTTEAMPANDALIVRQYNMNLDAIRTHYN